MNSKANLMMEIFPWNDDFNIGITKIDKQHHKLVDLINQLAKVMIMGGESQLADVLEELGNYAQFHFHDEEKIWKTYLENDNSFKKHQATHDSFMKKILKIRANQGEKSFQLMVEEIVRFLIHWLAFHILDTDKRMALTIQGIKNGMSVAQAQDFCDQEMFNYTKVLIHTVLAMYDNLSVRTIDLMRERSLRIQAEQALKKANDSLEEKVLERTLDLKVAQEATMIAMGSLAEIRDLETGFHIRRTQHYVKLLAEQLAKKAKFSNFLTTSMIEALYLSAALHDIGKVGIPDEILHKPGKLSYEEFEIMKQHAVFGRDAIQTAESIMDKNKSFLVQAKEIAYSHHEKWDGSGYPEGFIGEQIPLSARIMAVADVYDALIAKRVYKEPFSHEKAVSIIIQGKGTHFDPDMIDAFIQISDGFYQISKNFEDPVE